MPAERVDGLSNFRQVYRYVATFKACSLGKDVKSKNVVNDPFFRKCGEIRTRRISAQLITYLCALPKACLLGLGGFV